MARPLRGLEPLNTDTIHDRPYLGSPKPVDSRTTSKSSRRSSVYSTPRPAPGFTHVGLSPVSGAYTPPAHPVSSPMGQPQARDRQSLGGIAGATVRPPVQRPRDPQAAAGRPPPAHVERVHTRPRPSIVDRENVGHSVFTPARPRMSGVQGVDATPTPMGAGVKCTGKTKHKPVFTGAGMSGWRSTALHPNNDVPPTIR